LEFECENGKGAFLLIWIADVPDCIDKNWADIGISAFDCYYEDELRNMTLRYSMRGDHFITNRLYSLKLCKQSRFCVAGERKKLNFLWEGPRNFLFVDSMILYLSKQKIEVDGFGFLKVRSSDRTIFPYRPFLIFWWVNG
jgi:hypothetical protein